MRNNMQKWEIEKQKKIHDCKVKAAKPTLRYQNTAPTDSNLVTSSQEESEIESSLYKILKTFSLQQYFKRLCDMNYEHNIPSLAHLSSPEKEELYEHLHIMPGHKSKFESLFTFLKQLQPRPETTRRSSSINHSNKERTRLPTSGGQRKLSAKVGTQREDPNAYKHILDKFKNLDLQAESEIYRDDALKLLGTAKSIGSDTTEHSTEEEKLKLQRELELANFKIEELRIELERRQYQQKQDANIESPKSSARSFDPFAPLPEIEKRNTEVNVSYDSAKMRSTLHHIDVEEMCRSLSKVILKLVKHGMDVEKNRSSDPALRISLASLPDFFDDTSLPESMRSRNSISSNYTSTIGSSLDYSADSISVGRYIELEQIDEASQENSPIKVAGEVTIPRSIHEIFKDNFDDLNAFPNVVPIESEIYNFSKNVIIRSKMEKECSIISLIYIERLIEKTNLYVTEMN